jgi:acyl-CoA thioesterase
MTTYTELLAGLKRGADGKVNAHVPADWMQGRTTYGGLTAALCLEAARGLVDDLPLRSAQVAFVGPSGGEISLKPTLLRRGKNTAFVSVDMTQPAGFAAQCIFAFGNARESSQSFQHIPMPDVPSPDTAKSFFGEGPRPGFVGNFDMKGVLGDAPITGSDKRSIGLWMRHKDNGAPLDATAILAIADAPPPAILSMLKTPAPISSMTWMAEFLTEDIATEDGWFFALHTADTAMDGYSSQSMTLWNSTGEPILIGRQTITVFG